MFILLWFKGLSWNIHICIFVCKLFANDYLLSIQICTVCGVSLGVQNSTDGLRQIDRVLRQHMIFVKYFTLLHHVFKKKCSRRTFQSHLFYFSKNMALETDLHLKQRGCFERDRPEVWVGQVLGPARTLFGLKCIGTGDKTRAQNGYNAWHRPPKL